MVVEEVQTVRVDGRRTFRPVPESRAEIPCDLLLIAAGFVGTERGSLLDRLGVEVDPERGSMRVRGSVGDLRRGRLRLRRRDPRRQPGGLGDRRGPGLRGRRRRGAERPDRAAGAGPAGRPPALTVSVSGAVDDGRVRYVVVAGAAPGSGSLRAVDDRGCPIGPVEEVDYLPAAVAARRA